MDICVIPSAELSYESGSTLYAYHYTNYLAELGHNVYVICSKLPNVPNERVTYIILDILEHPVIDDYDICNQRMWDSINKITELIICMYANGIKLDIIHAHYATINAMAALNAKVILGIPFLISSFGRDIFNGSDSDERYMRMVKTTLNNADYIICSSEIVREGVEQLSGTLQGEKIVLEMPIDTRTFHSVHTHYSNHKSIFTILSVVSCFGKEKGIEVTIEAVRLLKEKGYTIRLYILGRDEHPEQKNYIYYKSLIEKYDLNKEIYMIGQVKNVEVAKWLKRTDVLIDSRIVGNYSSVILEALAIGRAIVASATKGNSEFIVDGYNGLLYEVGNSGELSSRIEYMINNPQSCVQLEKNAHIWFEQNRSKYDFEEHVNTIVKIYHKIAEKYK